MSRRLKNWIDTYVDFTHDTESNTLFNTWVGVSTIASALRKKTWLEIGRLKVYPNLYIILVAEPGVARKSQAMSYATNIIKQVEEIRLAADSTTPQALIDELVNAAEYIQLPNGDVFRHSSISVVSKEFDSFLSGAGVGKMIVTLTDLFDHGEQPWLNRTKSYGTEIIPAPFVNILGATTPRNLSSVVIGGGLSSRLLLVYAEGKAKRVTFPAWTPELAELEGALACDLRDMAVNIVGNFEFDCFARVFWHNWYMRYDESVGARVQKNNDFDGWYSRKPLFIQKVSMILSASRGNSRVINIEDIKNATELIEDTESVMHLACTSKDYSTGETRHTERLLGIIQREEMIKEDFLLHLVWRDMTEDVFDESIAWLRRQGKIKCLFEHNGVEGVWFKAVN